MNAIALPKQPTTSIQHPILSCHWRTQRSGVKNLSNAEANPITEFDEECDRTLPATRHLNPTRGYVIGEHSEAE